MNIRDPTKDFKSTLDAFINHLKKFNKQITFSGNEKGGEFDQIFRGKQPNFT